MIDLSSRLALHLSLPMFHFAKNDLQIAMDIDAGEVVQ
jgi:hypothetical protein